MEQLGIVWDFLLRRQKRLSHSTSNVNHSYASSFYLLFAHVSYKKHCLYQQVNTKHVRTSFTPNGMMILRCKTWGNKYQEDLSSSFHSLLSLSLHSLIPHQSVTMYWYDVPACLHLLLWSKHTYSCAEHVIHSISCLRCIIFESSPTLSLFSWLE